MTNLGVALYMTREGELPYCKAIPIRTMYAQIRRLNPMQSAYRDNWHMHRHLDKASRAFMYTLLTGHCALDEAPADVMSTQWEEWMAHKVGYEAAWTMTFILPQTYNAREQKT